MFELILVMLCKIVGITTLQKASNTFSSFMQADMVTTLGETVEYLK
jgi:hypothetical protein